MRARGVQIRKPPEPSSQRVRLAEPIPYPLWPREAEHFPGARFRIAHVGEARKHAGTFINKWQGLSIVLPLEPSTSITGGLLLDRRDLLTPVRGFCLDDADRVLVDEQNVIGGADIRLILTNGNPEACTEVDFLLILNKPASLLQHRINVVACLLFGCLVGFRHSDHPPCAFDPELVGGPSASSAWCSSTYVRMNSRSTWAAGLSCAWHTCTKRSRRSLCTLMRKPVSFISISVANGCTFVEKTLPLEKLTGASQWQSRKQGLTILPPKPENST